MANINHIQHIHSKEVTESGIKLPSPSDLLDGEIAVNYAPNREAIAIKNGDDKIATFSSDNVTNPRFGKIESNLDDLNYAVSMLTSNNTSGARGYDEVSPTLQMIEGDKEKLWGVLRHFKLGWFDGEGKLVYECAPCRISQAVDGTDIPIDGSLKDASGNSCDLMVYTDTDLYVDRCTVSGLNVEDSTATTHNVIGLGLKPHKVRDKEAKKFEPFGFTPYFAIIKDKNNQRVLHSYDDHSTVAMSTSFLENINMVYNKGGNYMGGIYYEFYEIWYIALYLELGFMNFAYPHALGWGCTNLCNYRPSAENWYKKDIVGGLGFLSNDGITYRPYNDVWGIYNMNFFRTLESLKVIDNAIKNNLIDKIEGDTLLEYGDDGNLTIAPSSATVTNYNAMKETDRYYTIQGIKGCQGLKDGVATCIVNIYYRTHTSGGTYAGDYIAKESHPIYRGVELFGGFFIPLNGINYVIKQHAEGIGYNKVQSIEFFYADSWHNVLNNINSEDTIVKNDISSGIVPTVVSKYKRGGNYEPIVDFEIKECDYNQSLFAVKSVWSNINQYECGYIACRGVSYSSPLGAKENGYLTNVGQSANICLGGGACIYNLCGRNCFAHMSYLSDSEQSYAFSHPQIKLR